eukprot:CAMPEP_0183351666 /NCGR_PEP_ID=MMETSP0164_2-20130417/26177_1 /TAXON_ID=221442 /ORGANISM="Coccolithus pelagicus ssp braarudi, Strain PLY182g" /LENGTH=167 /DNA_ID=CAMNT_0025523907 /DNA_START=4 /DNA_END=508 /DNA_ORIENTATION=+
MSSLFNAAFDGDTAEVRKQINRGADVNWANSWGQTSIWIASQNGKAETVAALLECGANHSMPDKKAGKTPLEIAKAKKHMHVVALIEEADRPKTEGLADVMESAGLSNRLKPADRWCVSMGISKVSDLTGNESKLASHLVLDSTKAKAFMAAVQKPAWVLAIASPNA